MTRVSLYLYTVPGVLRLRVIFDVMFVALVCLPLAEGPRRVTKLTENYLSLTGYRLPTEAEFEYAAKAGEAIKKYGINPDKPSPARA